MSDLAHDPVTRKHIERAADNLQGEFAGVFSQETIERYIERVDRSPRRCEVNAFVPVLASVRP